MLAPSGCGRRARGRSSRPCASAPPRAVEAARESSEGAIEAGRVRAGSRAKPSPHHLPFLPPAVRATTDSARESGPRGAPLVRTYVCRLCTCARGHPPPAVRPGALSRGTSADIASPRELPVARAHSPGEREGVTGFCPPLSASAAFWSVCARENATLPSKISASRGEGPGGRETHQTRCRAPFEFLPGRECRWRDARWEPHRLATTAAARGPDAHRDRP